MSWSNVYLSTADKSGAIDFLLGEKAAEIKGIFDANRLFYCRFNQRGNHGVVLSLEGSSNNSIDRKQLYFLEEIAKVACVEATYTYSPMYVDAQLDNLGRQHTALLQVIEQKDNHIDVTFQGVDNINVYYEIAVECSQWASKALSHEIDRGLSRKTIMPSVMVSVVEAFANKNKGANEFDLLGKFYESISKDIPKDASERLEVCFEDQCKALQENNVDILSPVNCFTDREQEIIAHIDSYSSKLVESNCNVELFVFLLHSLFNNLGFSLAEEIYLTYLVRSLECGVEAV